MTINKSTIALLSLGLLAFSACDQSGDSPEALIFEDVDHGASTQAVDGSLVDHTNVQKVVAGFDLTIAKIGSFYALEWASQGESVTYEVWMSNDPYFSPEDAGSVMLAGGLTELDYVDDTGDEVAQRYYRVRAQGNAGGLSTAVGQITTEVHPGYTKVGVCLINDIDTSAELVADFDSYPHSAHAWDSVNQEWVNALSGDDPGLSFALGEAVSVFHHGVPAIEDDTYTMVGQVPTAEDVMVTLRPGDNLVATVPVHFGELMASELLPLVPDGTRIGAWDAATQTNMYYPDDGDFSIPMCSPIHVEVTSESAWPPPLPVADPCPCTFTVEAMAANGLDDTNTCFDLQAPDVQAILSDSFGLHGIGLSEASAACITRNSTATPIELFTGLTADEFASCQADFDTTYAALNPPPC